MFFAFLHHAPKRISQPMKRFLILLAVAFAAASLHADLVLQQQIATPTYTGVTAMKIKGAKVRMDMYAGQPQASSFITDLDTGETITIMHSQKLFLKTAGTPMKQTKPASAGNATDSRSKAPVPHATGKTQKVGDYDTELYTWSNARGITGTAWVAKNFPDFARIRTDIAALDKIAGADNDTSPELSTLPGMVVRSEVTGGGQTLSLALISAKEGPLDASLFGVPRDYKELPQPKPVKTVTTQPAPQKPSSHSTPTAPAPAPKTTTTPTQKLPAW
jgi:hypothetical protein